MAYSSKEKQAAYMRLYYQRNAERLRDYEKQKRDGRTQAEQQAYLEYQRQYREANHEQLREKMRQHYRENQQERARAKRDARKRNPDHVRSIDKRSRAKYPDKVRERARRWYDANKDHVQERGKQYRREKHEKILETNRQYRKKQPDKVRSFERKYQESHPEVRKTASQNRAARKRGAAGSHTPADIQALWEHQQHRCAVAGCPHPIADSGKDRYHVDHIMPILLGGSNDASNLQILCRRHNLSKNSLHPEVWKRRLERSA